MECGELVEVGAGRMLFKKGEYYRHFYAIESGLVRVTINQISIDLEPPLICGDYELHIGIEYRITTIRAIVKSSIRLLPIAVYPSHAPSPLLDQALSTLPFRNRLLRFWLRKLFQLINCQRGEEAGTIGSFGIVLQGQFRIDKRIPISRLKDHHLLKKFELCSMAPNEFFQGIVVCDTAKGAIAICQPKYLKQLRTNFQDFEEVDGLVKVKVECHDQLTNSIESSCRSRPVLLQQMVPLTLQHQLISYTDERNIQNTSKLIRKSPKKQLKQVELKEQHHPEDNVFSVSDNISQFLKLQWRRGLSLKVRPKQRVPLSLSQQSRQISNAVSSPKRKLENLTNADLISLSIPREFRQEKFKMKMLLRARQPMGGFKSIRLRTEPNNPPRSKLFLT